jgi:DNA repair protein RadC
MLKGKAASDAEFAILIGSGSRNESAVDLSRRILKSVDNLNAIGKLSITINAFKGIGKQSYFIIAAMELGRRRTEDALEFTKVTQQGCI